MPGTASVNRYGPSSTPIKKDTTAGHRRSFAAAFAQR
jgi:hypothetical protein